MHIHITGASGSGATTLAAALASDLGSEHLDADDFYWLPTEPSYRSKRQQSERFSLLTSALTRNKSVVLSGSVVGWGQDIEDAFGLIVFLYLPADIRVQRLRAREMARFGKVDQAFLDWATLYDVGPPEGRSLEKHNAWLAERSCPVLRLDQDESVALRVARVRSALPNHSFNPRPATASLVRPGCASCTIVAARPYKARLHGRG